MRRRSYRAPLAVLAPHTRLIVTATYLTPTIRLGHSAASVVETKMCSSKPPITLRYGDRNAFVNGIDALIAKPLLTMEQEFRRNATWSDWKGKEFTLKEEWAYVNGPAQTMAGCTPGTRDEENDGMMPYDFLSLGNGFIRKQREAGIGLLMLDTHAYLTLDEVISVRLYSGPAFQPINEFLRQASRDLSATSPHTRHCPPRRPGSPRMPGGVARPGVVRRRHPPPGARAASRPDIHGHGAPPLQRDPQARCAHYA